MTLAQQRATELAHQKQALKAEFVNWRARTQRGQPLEKHHTQVDRITRQLDTFLDEIGDPAASFPGMETFSRKLLGAHRIWAYFREKLALRDVTWFRNDLVCADEFAWECYRPAREKAKAAGTIATGALKQPPLIFFSLDPSPFMRPRDSLILEGLTQRDVEMLGAALLKLPIPVIGIPWFQIHHLPAAASIGHEVGHAVERDLSLEGKIQELFDGLGGVPASRLEAWSAWCHELFADLYGILCTGPAHVMALMDYLIDEPSTIQHEQRSAPNWHDYPTRFLRMLFNFEALSKVGLKDENLEKAWKDTYKFHAMSKFESDIPEVVDAFLQSPLPTLGDADLQAVIAFTQSDLVSANTMAERINRGFSLPVGQPFRQLLAAATLAFHDDPQSYEQRNAGQAIVDRMLAAIPPGVREREELSAQERAERDAADQETGRSLAALFD